MQFMLKGSKYVSIEIVLAEIWLKPQEPLAQLFTQKKKPLAQLSKPID